MKMLVRSYAWWPELDANVAVMDHPSCNYRDSSGRVMNGEKTLHQVKSDLSGPGEEGETASGTPMPDTRLLQTGHIEETSGDKMNTADAIASMPLPPEEDELRPRHSGHNWWAMVQYTLPQNLRQEMDL
eukprot:g36743.t1